MDRSRVLIIGLDGATWSVLDPWLADGTMPHLASLRACGASGVLRSTLPPLTPPAWASFLTGKNPGKHGVFHFAQMTAETADVAAGTPDLVDSRSIRSATIWDIVGHHGGRVVTINMPMSYPPRPVNGVMLTCLLTPADVEVFTYPPELSGLLPDYRIDLDRFIGEKPFQTEGDGPKQRRTVEPSVELVQEFEDMERIRGRTALDLMRSEPWDVFSVVFTAPDRMGHYLWPWHQIDAQASDATDAAIAAGIRDVYRTIDEAIGALVAAAGDDVHVVVCSDHGMGATHTRNVHWNAWLHAQGLAVTQGAVTPDAMLLRLGVSRDRVGRAVRRLPGVRSSRIVARARTAPTATLDLERSRAYYVRVFDPVGGIRINATGAERDRIRDDLLRRLPAVMDPETGCPILVDVRPREEVYTGPYVDRMPDLVTVMRPGYGSSDRLSAYSAVATPRTSPTGDSGAHRIEGIVLLAGPTIPARATPLEGISIIDLAPTVLYLMDLPVPEDMDGHVVVDAIDTSALATHPVQSGPPSRRWPDDRIDDLTASEPNDDRVRERLRDLGYVE